LYGLLVWMSDGQQRLALAFVGLFFVLSLWILSKINLQRGMQAARVA
ncbi:MAG: MFS transporter, partial [Betaproteobacteria bacterium]|nr:MFS transporter [Betaproteobacteria bacterium]